MQGLNLMYVFNPCFIKNKVMKNLFLTFQFIKAFVWVIFFLIKNKGHFKIVMQTDSFDDDYWIDKDNEDIHIKTTLYDLIGDIYCCNK